MKRFLLLMSSFLIVVSAQQCRTTYSSSGSHLKGHVMSTNNVKNMGKCLDTCKKDQQCRSMNVKSRRLDCELNNADRPTHPWDYEFKDGYAYSDYPAKVSVTSNCLYLHSYSLWSQLWIAFMFDVWTATSAIQALVKKLASSKIGV